MVHLVWSALVATLLSTMATALPQGGSDSQLRSGTNSAAAGNTLSKRVLLGPDDCCYYGNCADPRICGG